MSDIYFNETKSPSMTGSFEEFFVTLDDSPAQAVEQQEFLTNLDNQINKRLSQGIKQAMQLVIK